MLMPMAIFSDADLVRGADAPLGPAAAEERLSVPAGKSVIRCCACSALSFSSLQNTDAL